MKGTLSALSMAGMMLVALPLLAIAQQGADPGAGGQPYWDCGGPWHMAHTGWGFWWLFPLFMLFCLLFVFIFLARTIGMAGTHHWGPWRHMTGGHWSGGSWGDLTASALQILNERYARGEIQKPEYDEKKATIVSIPRH